MKICWEIGVDSNWIQFSLRKMQFRGKGHASSAAAGAPGGDVHEAAHLRGGRPGPEALRVERRQLLDLRG